MSLLFGTGAIAGSAAKGAPGMVLLTPTSIAHSGTSASIGANGQVTFTAVTSLSLDGVFSADFDNYMVNIRHLAGGGDNVNLRLRASGVDATGTDYATQRLGANGTTVSASRSTAQDHMDAAAATELVRSGDTFFLYGPYLAQPTAHRSLNVRGSTGGRIDDFANTHSLSTSYDGFTLYITSNLTGALQVYGIRS